MFSDLTKCLELIDRRTAVRGFVIAGLMLIAAMLEAFGLGLIYAFIRILLNPAEAPSIPMVGPYIRDVAAGDNSQAIVIIIAALLIVFLLKNLLLIGFYYIQAQFIAVNEATLSTHLLERYLNGAYILHISRNSADFIRNITGSVTAVFSSVTMGFITLASELFVVLTVGIVLIVLEPVFTLGSALILGIAVGVFFKFSRSLVHGWGRQEQEYQGNILQALQQGFHSIKEVKILGRESYIRNSFVIPRAALARVRTKFTTMAQAPRIWTETVVVATILIGVLGVILSGGSIDEILSALTLFAAATFRIIPSMNRILLALNSIKGGSHAVNIVYKDFREFERNPDIAAGSDDTSLPFRSELALNDVSFRYRADEPAVLADISLTLRPGESLGLVGPSGAGKTTLVDILTGLLQPTSGSVTVDGRNILEAAPQWRKQLGYVPQTIYITDDTLRHNIAFGLHDDEIDEARLENAVRLAQLPETIASMPKGLDTVMGESGARLSGGQRQRVGIARALYNNPEILIFDEATSALDSETEHEITLAINALKGRKTVIVIAHRLTTVRQCDRLVFLRGGRIADTGPFDTLVKNNPEFRNLVELARL